jgi:3-oxoacyl-[acyl-carrier protein] reductase
LRKLDGKAGIVTGGASGIGRAIGSAICARLAADGYDIALSYHSNKKAADIRIGASESAVRSSALTATSA